MLYNGQQQYQRKKGLWIYYKDNKIKTKVDMGCLQYAKCYPMTEDLLYATFTIISGNQNNGSFDHVDDSDHFASKDQFSPH